MTDLFEKHPTTVGCFFVGCTHKMNEENADGGSDMAWRLQTVKKMRAVRAAGNTLLRVRYDEPAGDSPAACHLRAVLAAFLSYAEQKGRERCEKQAARVPLYTVALTTETAASCTVVHLTFSFDGERPPVTLTEYWQGDGAWQIEKPRRRKRFPQNSKKSAKIQQ